VPATQREKCRAWLLGLLASSADGLFRHEIMAHAVEEGFSPRYVSDVARSLPITRTRQGRFPSIWRLS
jgi:hypothetical protein